jgi:DNA-binding response OmpR family regulator
MQRILIFDDDTDILELCSIILTGKGFEVIVKATCENVVQTAIDSRPDVILMDNWIPDIGGVDATQQLKNSETTRHIPVIFFSANNQTETFSHEAGADSYIQKPFDINDLVETISTAIKNNVKESLRVTY